MECWRQEGASISELERRTILAKLAAQRVSSRGSDPRLTEPDRLIRLALVCTTSPALADTDPLGVPSTVSFDSVGGLGSHIQQLKEMVSLPLLYPEVFERFAITPPRGVLFHGPPGTGKTLLARALAASCSTDGRKICESFFHEPVGAHDASELTSIQLCFRTLPRSAFFMRKGADCLSKWVGEAERQLRLLFEEAKNCQPSIIFFDEIDGAFLLSLLLYDFN